MSTPRIAMSTPRIALSKLRIAMSTSRTPQVVFASDNDHHDFLRSGSRFFPDSPALGLLS